VARVAVDEHPVRLELSVEEGDEHARRGCGVDHPVHPLDNPHDLQVLVHDHPEPRDDVAGHEGGGESVSRRVGDRDSENDGEIARKSNRSPPTTSAGRDIP